MNFVENLKIDLKKAMIVKDSVLRDNLRSVIAEFERQSKKDFSEDEVFRVIKSMIKLEIEKCQAINQEESQFLDFLKDFLPKQVDEKDVEKWIAENVDFSKFKNNIQAMGMVMKHFGNSADGNMVRQVISKF